MSEDKSSKTNGVGPDPMQRLATFRPPRDLTLGGIKTSKKVFTPNLNVSRNKNKGPAKPQLHQRKDDKDKKEKRNDRNRNFRNGPNIIKSTGVFSEGLGSAERHSSRASYGSRDSDRDTVQAMQKPTIRVKDFVKIDKELEEQKINTVLNDGNLDEDSKEDFKRVLERDAPIILPMVDGASQHKVKPTVMVKQEVIVKREPEDNYCGNALSVAEEKVRPDVKEVFENTDLVNLLRTDQPTLILLQLPDSLPGCGGKMEDDFPRRKGNEEPSTSSGEGKEEKPVDNSCRLLDLEEGRIGKLLVHRSGRVSLALGDTMFEVSMGTKPAFHQEVVSVGTDDASRSASLVALGAVQHKLNIVPDWETMFLDMSV